MAAAPVRHCPLMRLAKAGQRVPHDNDTTTDIAASVGYPRSLNGPE